jgi:transposase
MARAKKDYQRLRLLAREMFVFLGYEQKDIAEELGVNQGTVGKW